MSLMEQTSWAIAYILAGGLSLWMMKRGGANVAFKGEGILKAFVWVATWSLACAALFLAYCQWRLDESP